MKIVLIATAVSLWIATPVSADNPLPPTDRSWHLLTQTEGGVINLIKDLTKHECEYAMHRAKGEPATDEEIAAEKQRQKNIADEARGICQHPEKYDHSVGYVYVMCNKDDSVFGPAAVFYGPWRQIQPGDIKTAECFQ
jgi:hypothetical protein